MLKSINPYKLFLFSTVLSLIVGGCNHTKDDVTPVDASLSKQTAKTHVVKNLKSTRRAFESQITNANSTQVIVNTGLLDLDLSVLNNLFSRSGGSEPSAQTSLPIKIKTRSEKLAKRDSDAENSSEAMSEFVEQIFNKILINPSVEGNTINHAFDSDLLCTNETDTDLTDCIDLWSKARLVQQVIDDNSGTLAFQFDNSQPFMVSYTATSISLEVSLSDIKSTLIAIDNLADNQDDSIELPEIFEGHLKASISSPDDNTSSFTLSIPQAIRIAGIIDQKTIDFSMDTTNQVVKISADALAKTAKIEFGLTAIKLIASLSNEMETASYPLVFALEKLTGTINFNGNNKTLNIQNIDIGNTPLSLTIDGNQAMSLSMTPINARVDSTNGSISLDSSIDIAYAINNIYGLLSDQFKGASNASLAGTITASLPADTVLEVINSDTATEITKINTGGPLDIIGTDFFSGNFQVLEGECMQESQTAVFGLAMVTCP